MRTDIPCRQRMTRAIGSASLGRAPKSDRDLRRAPNPRPRPRRPRRSGRRFRAPADAPLRRERPRLGARGRNGPVRRVRLREARPRLPRHPRPLLPGHDDRHGPGAARPHPARPEEGEAYDLLHGGLHRHRRDRRDARRRRGDDDLRLEAEAQGGRRREGEGAAGAAPLRAGNRSARARPPVSRPDPGHRRRDEAPGGRRRRARAVPPGRRAGRDAAHVGARGAEGSGRRGALVRALAPPGRQLRPLPRHAEPGLPRRRRRDAGDECGRPGDRGPGRALRGPRREDVLLLHLGRPDDVRRRRLGNADPLPRVRARPLRHALALPRLGPLRLHGGGEAEPDDLVQARGRHAPDGAGADPRRASRPLRPHPEQDFPRRRRPPGAAERARRDPAAGRRRLEHRGEHPDRRERQLRRVAPTPRGELPGPRDARARLRPGHDEAARGRLGVRRLAAAAAATGLALAGSAAAARAAGFVPNDPLAPRQWYLSQDHTFDFWPPELPQLPGAGVRVAVIDSGIDGGHPDLAGRVVAAKSFVGGSPLTDEEGHGTFVAGEIAATTNNGLGIAGIAFPAKLVVAKVVRGEEIPLGAETAAIRWAVGQGARVINLSLGGLRDPGDPLRDTFSPAEASAIDYAVAHGVVVVAAVGNGDQAPRTPWPYASYPAALPHVVGVSAFARDGSVPAFSNRDATFNDLTAPGQDILSTLPRHLTASRPTCVDQGYSDCGSDDYVHASGTSFSAPQVSAAAALLLAIQPTLKADP